MNKVQIPIKNKNTKLDKRAILVMVPILFYGFYAMDPSFPLNTIASIMLLILVITLPSDKDIYVYTALIPFYSFVPQNSPIRLSFFFLISIFKIFWEKGMKISRRSGLYFCIWFGLEIMMDLLYAPGFDYTVVLLMMYFAVHMMKCRTVDVEIGNTLVLIMIFSFAVAVVFTTLTSETSLTYYLQTTNAEARFGEDARNLGGAMDIPIFCAIAIALVLGKFIFSRHTKIFQKIIYIGIIGICLVFGALTVSRSFILATAAIVVWTYISLIKDSKYRNKIIPITILVLVCIVVLLWKNQDIITNIFNKYSQREFFASSRSQIYSDCFDYLVTHPLNLFFGTGAFGYHYTGIKYDFAFRMFAHNLFLDAIMSWGIIGTTAFGALIYSNYKAMKKCYGNPHMACFLPSVAWGVIMMTGGTFNYVEPYLYLMVLSKLTYSFKVLGDE